jgi:hypothetical protein
VSSLLRTIRLAAILLPAALLLHELAYAVAGGGMLGAHHYLEVAVPVAGALAASLALAALLLPVLGVSGSTPERHAPFAIALALAGIFVVQELIEAFVLGGGMQGLAASLAVAWLLPPLALMLGALCSALDGWLESAGEVLAAPAAPKPTHATGRPALQVPADPWLATPACAGLAFGFARRPPPARPAHPAS